MTRFGGIGVVNTAVDFGLYAALVAAGAAPLAANVAGFLAANAQSYVLNARFTFRKNGAAARTSLTGYIRFAGAHIVSLLISSAMIVLLASKVGPVFAKAGAVGFTFLWNYWTSALFAYRDGPEGRTPGANA